MSESPNHRNTLFHFAGTDDVVRVGPMSVSRNIEEAYVAIVQTIGVRPCLLSHKGESGDRFDAAAYADVLDRLADLIDPTCHAAHSETAADNELVCSECGALVGVEVTGGKRRLTRYCECCGARVVSE